MIINLFLMKIKLQLELILLKNVKLIAPLCTVLMVPFSFCMLGNLEFLGKSATFPQYVLVIVDLFSSKIYTYSTKSRKQILQKLKIFYNDVRNKRKGKRMTFQVDNEFQQVKVKDLNDLKNVEMFTTSV